MTTLVLITCLSIAAKPAYDPTSDYTKQSIEGWTVYVNNRLLDEKESLGQKALDLLRVKLYEINRAVPKRALQQLHEVPIVAALSRAQNLCPQERAATYHPSKEWLSKNGYNPEKGRSIEIGDPTNFINWTRHQPSMVLHELAHAYQHRVLGYDTPDVKPAYKRAVESNSYESVLRYDGKKARAYALNNDQEYFAELTDGYFGANDFYPFVRAEIMRHDFQMYETLRKLWDR